MQKESQENDNNKSILNALLTSLPQNVYWKDKNGIYLGCNHAAAKMLGISSPGEIIGKTDEDIFGADYDRAIIENDKKVISEQKPLIIEEKIVDPSGRKLTYLSHKVPMFDDAGQVVGVFGISFNVTEQKQLEETLYRDKKEIEQDIDAAYAAVYGDSPQSDSKHKEKLDLIKGYYENIIALMPGNVFWVNKEGVFLGCNDNVAKILGLPSRHEVVGKTHHDLMASKLAAEAINNDLKVMQENKAIAFEEKGFSAEGEPAYYFSRKVPLLNKHKHVAGLLGTSLDITELKQKEADLAKALEAAKAADKLKTQIINNISHDIRTPLNGIVHPSTILYEHQENLSEMQRDLVDAIYTSSHRLKELIEHILDFGRVKSGRLKLSLGDVNVAEVLRLVVDNINSMCRAKGLNFIIDYPPEVVRHIVSDSSCITQILLNLLSNAIQHTEKGHVLARFREMVRDDGAIWLQCEVEDTGTGIPEDKLKEIFGEFHKLSESSTTNQRNYGLGLAIVRELLSLLDGEINVTSQVGKGSTFQIWIPVVKVANTAPIETWQSRYPHVHVLVVDNNIEEGCAYIHQLMESLFDIHPRQSALAELDKAKQTGKPYRVVLVDENIRGDCIEFLKEAKQQVDAEQTLFILMTPVTTQSKLMEFIDAGYQTVIQKPFLPEEFHAQLISAWRLFENAN